MPEIDFEELSVRIKAELDDRGIKSDLLDIQKIISNSALKANVQLDEASLKNGLKDLSNQFASELRDKFKLNISDNDFYKIFSQQITQASASTRKLATDLQKITTAGNMQKWLDSNTKAVKGYGNEITNMIMKLTSMDDMTYDEFQNIKKRFSEIQIAARKTGDIGMTAMDKLKNAWEKFGGWSIATGSLMAVVNQLRQIPKEVIAVDSALTELSKVSNATRIELQKAFEDSAQSAKELGATVSDVISATADWSRLGYSLPDSKELARVAVLYKNVGDNIDIDTANQSLVSTLQGFQLEADEALGIIDKFNEVANNFPIDSAGIGEALQRSAASFNAANTDLSESIALIAGTNAVVQDPDSVGNMWKTVSMRIRGTKQELEEAGEDVDGMVESTSQLRDLIQGLTGFDIMEDAAGTQFKDIYEIVIGIGKEWKNLSDIEQAGLLETLAGKRQGNALAAALNNVEMIEEAYNTAENSAGSAMREQSKYEESIQYSLDRLQASYQEFANTVLDSNLLKTFVDIGNTAVNVFTKLSEVLGAASSLGGNISGTGGTLGALAGLIMNIAGKGKLYCTAPLFI